jgi:hypothetical protein
MAGAIYWRYLVEAALGSYPHHVSVAVVLCPRGQPSRCHQSREDGH